MFGPVTEAAYLAASRGAGKASDRHL